MTLAEYNLRLEAYSLKMVETQNNLAMQAWFNQQVQATTKGKHPKPKFKKFQDFFDREEAEQEVRERFSDSYSVPNKKPTKKEVNDVFFKRYKEAIELQKSGQLDPNAWKKIKGGRQN